MDLSYLYDQKKLMLDRIVKEQQDDSTFNRLDEGRQHDVIQCILAIKTSKNPKEVKAARKALKTIYMEFNDPVLRRGRHWYMNERKHGRFDNSKNFVEDTTKNKRRWNPYG